MAQILVVFEGVMHPSTLSRNFNDFSRIKIVLHYYHIVSYRNEGMVGYKFYNIGAIIRWRLLEYTTASL